MWQCVLVSLVYFLQGLQAFPVQLSDQYNSTVIKKDKKGTIRIAGPWHSDSALDRNIDPGEDSYVKKIISTNEGINFNKDMAEAGEMFDVNGIEDFYDKNAMITYEVNGHEVPVHMKPKYTPQSKSMFPEYVRETPAAIGLTRHARPLSMQNPSQHKFISLKAISGFTSKDLPEYNVHDSPSLHGNNRDNDFKNMPTQKFLHDSPSSYGHMLQSDEQFPWRTATSSATSHLNNDEGTSKVNTANSMTKQETETHDERIEQEANLRKKIEEAKLLHSIELAKLRYEKLHESDVVDQTHRVAQDDTSKFRHEKHDENNDFTHHRLHQLAFHHKSHETDEPMRPQSTNDVIENDKFVKGSEKDQEMLQHSFSDHNDDSHKALEFHQHHYPDSYEDNEHSPERSNNAEVTSLFSKLENLHKKLKNEKDLAESASQEEHKPVAEGPEKVKAKTRILSLLGELSSKLKGMEAVVSGGHKVEQFHDEYPSKQGSSKEMEKGVEIKDQQASLLGGEPHSEEQAELQSIQEKMYESKLRNDEHAERNDEHVDESDNLKSKVSSSNRETTHSLQDHTNEPHPDMIDNSITEKQQSMDSAQDANRIAEERASETADKIRLDEEKSIESNTVSKFKSYPKEMETEEEHHSSIVPDIIEHFREQSTPSIMDTSSIDYKPAIPGISMDEGSDDGEEEQLTKPHIKNHKKSHHHNEEEEDENEEEDSENEEEKNNETKKHHHQHLHHHKSQIKHSHKHKHNKSFDSDNNDDDNDAIKDDTDDGSATKKVNDVAESLASADDNSNSNNGIARERTYHPKHFPTDDIEYPDYNDVKDAAIFETNLLRKRYHANKLLWSDRLSDRAQQEAEKLARRSDFDGEKLESFKSPGENLALIKLNSPNVGKDAIDHWEKESKNYDFRSPQVTRKNNDFIQLMWQAEKEFGMGVAKSKHKKGWIVTSFYDVPFVDKFRDLKVNLKSEIPIDDPYSDITG